MGLAGPGALPAHGARNKEEDSSRDPMGTTPTGAH